MQAHLINNMLRTVKEAKSEAVHDQMYELATYMRNIELLILQNGNYSDIMKEIDRYIKRASNDDIKSGIRKIYEEFNIQRIRNERLDDLLGDSN